eukprot:10756847-Alexandrium_andersonii.AAC.1
MSPPPSPEGTPCAGGALPRVVSRSPETPGSTGPAAVGAFGSLGEGRAVAALGVRSPPSVCALSRRLT